MSFRDIQKTLKHRFIEALIDCELRSGHFRRSVLRRLYRDYMAKGALSYVQFPDHVLLVDPRDHMIAFSLVEGNMWQRREFDSALDISARAGVLKPGGWCIDVGANIGTQSIYAMLSGRFKGVVAIEPEPHNASLLRRNVALNGYEGRVLVVEAAASAGSGFAELTRDAENFGAHSLDRTMPRRQSDRIVVKTRSVDSILAELAIDPADVSLVLIDVEGHEIEALKGMQGIRALRIPIVAEITSAVHGADGIEALRQLLLPHYSVVAPLRGREVAAGPPVEHPLASFEFGQRQTDVLIYNAGTTPGAAEG